MFAQTLNSSAKNSLFSGSQNRSVPPLPAPLSVLTGLSITQNVTCVKSNSTLNHPLNEHIASKQIFGFYGAGQFDYSKLEILIFLANTPKTFKTFRRGLLVAKSDFS